MGRYSHRDGHGTMFIYIAAVKLYNIVFDAKLPYNPPKRNRVGVRVLLSRKGVRNSNRANLRIFFRAPIINYILSP